MRSALSHGRQPDGDLVLARAQIALLPDDLSTMRGHWSGLVRFVRHIGA